MKVRKVRIYFTGTKRLKGQLLKRVEHDEEIIADLNAAERNLEIPYLVARQSGDTNWLTWLASAINKIDDAREKHKRKMEH